MVFSHPCDTDDQVNLLGSPVGSLREYHHRNAGVLNLFLGLFHSMGESNSVSYIGRERQFPFNHRFYITFIHISAVAEKLSDCADYIIFRHRAAVQPDVLLF